MANELAPRTPVDAERIAALLPTAHLADRAHFDLLHEATLAEDRELIGRLVVAMVPTVMARPDRFGNLHDRYRTEVEPLLGLLIGAAMPDTEDYVDLLAAVPYLDAAFDHAVLTSRLIRRDLSEADQQRLDAGLKNQLENLRRSATSVRPRAQRDLQRDSRGVALLLSSLGRVRAARAVARIGQDDMHLAAATAFAASLRRRWVLDESIQVLDRVLERAPEMPEAVNARIGALADRGDFATAHRLALASFNVRPNNYGARALLRTSKAVGDAVAFSAAERFLQP